MMGLQLEEKYIGLVLAVMSSIAIGTSFVLTKQGLTQTQDRTGFEGKGYVYLKNPLWWAGMVTMGIGEVANFAAYAFAPAILVTPLGALSVLVGAVLGTYFLKEKLGVLGRLGCAICLIGSVVIVLHAPPDKEITRIDEILHLAIQPGFLTYLAIVAIFATIMIYKVSPKYGKTNPVVYLSTCSVVGSVTVLSIKAFGIALKLTFAGKNQFKYPSTYVFIIVTVVCILTQMNYFNKALAQFSSSIVNPIYYVLFTTCTLIGSFVLFRGFNTTNAVNTLSLLCGFLIIFAGVYLLNLSRAGDQPGHAPPGYNRANSLDSDGDGIPTDGLAGLAQRRSMQIRRSEGSRRSSMRLLNGSAVGGRSAHGHSPSLASARGRPNDEESALRGLVDEDSEPESEVEMGRINHQHHNGSARR